MSNIDKIPPWGWTPEWDDRTKFEKHMFESTRSGKKIKSEVTKFTEHLWPENRESGNHVEIFCQFVCPEFFIYCEEQNINGPERFKQFKKVLMDTSLDQFKEIIDEKYPNSRDQTNDNFLAAVQKLSYAMIGYPRARDVLYKALRSEKLEKPKLQPPAAAKTRFQQYLRNAKYLEPGHIVPQPGEIKEWFYTKFWKKHRLTYEINKTCGKVQCRRLWTA